MARTATEIVVGYCMKCRRKVNMVNPKVVLLKRGRSKVQMKSWAGVCPICSTKVFRIIGKA